MTHLPASSSPQDADALMVVCLCVDWCHVCRRFRPVFEELAQRYPALRFRWIDIEDHPELMGEVEVENFPTVLLCGANDRGFYGVIEPRSGVLQALIKQLVQGTYPYDSTVSNLKHSIKLHLLSS
jgi:thioredoxin 1